MRQFFLRGQTLAPYVFVEEGDDFPRAPSKVVVAVLKTFRGTLDPKQFLVPAPQQVEGLLRIFWISRPLVVQHLDYEHGRVHSGGGWGVISAANQPPISSSSRSMSS